MEDSLPTTSLARQDIEKTVSRFISRSKLDDRYTSFDYCYNYFRTIDDPEQDVEKSCLVLGFYLASWGMFRGSSFLLQKSAKHFQPLVQYLSALDRRVWDIDVDCYSPENVEIILKIYREVKSLIIPSGKTDLTLVTKVLLGVFGFVPAFDNYFTATFRGIACGRCGFRRVNHESLGILSDFYTVNKEAIDRLAHRTFTTDFLSGEKSPIRYPKAKIIDMYGFTAGLGEIGSESSACTNTKHSTFG